VVLRPAKSRGQAARPPHSRHIQSGQVENTLRSRSAVMGAGMEKGR
jgi:hypothetical protein